nr:BrnT family toxin [Leadbettera azotonutricia]
MEFEWDEEKNMANIQKHGVAFEDAIYVFLDPLYCEIFDWEHSSEFEERWIAYGLVNRVLMVSFIEQNDITRVISARRATRSEEEAYYYGYYGTNDFTGRG